MEAYVALVAFVAQDFKAFLLLFQSKARMIHLLYPAMLSFLCGHRRKFIREAKLSSEDLGENIRINVNAEKNAKPIRMIDVGTKAKTMFSQNMISDEGQEKFRKGCLKFFQVTASYLPQKLPFDINLLRNTEFLNPVKRKAGGATSAISNLALKVTSVLENVLGSIFQMESKHAVVDAIGNQWYFFQNEEIPEEWYVNQQAEKPTFSRHQKSYWVRAREECGLDSTLTSPACFVRINHFWRRIGNLVDEFGAKKYPQLAKLAQFVLSLSHGNSTPERGFSVNKLLLDVHGYSTYEDTIIALRIVKDELLRVGGILEFSITRELLDPVSASWSKYEAERLARLQAESAEKKKREQIKEENERRIVAEKQVAEIDDKIVQCKSNISVANDLIYLVQVNIKQAVEEKNTQKRRQLTQQGLSKLQVGTERKRKFEEDLQKLQNEKSDCLAKKNK